MGDSFTESRLRAALGARPFRFEPSVSSTNDIARQWALNGAPAGSVVLTEEQSAGRGRLGRVWTAPAGTALLSSTILRPRLDSDRLSRVTMLGAVAVAEVLRDLADPALVSLKWPNDVWLAGRKVAGILPEATWQGETLVAVVLGIGLNVRVSFVGTPLEGKAISIESVAGKPVDRADLLAKLLRRIDHWALRIEDPDLFQTWRGWLMTLGRPVVVSADVGRQAISGQALDVGDDGALLIRTDDGTIQRVMSGEIS